MTKRTKNGVYIVAGVLLIVALVWHMLLARNGFGTQVAREINAFGYAISADDIYPAGSWENTSIRELLPDENLSAAVLASKQVSLNADIDRRGQVALLLVHIGEETLSFFYVEGTLELAFSQRAGVIGALAG